MSPVCSQPSVSIAAAVATASSKYPCITFRAGDKILFGKYSGSEIKIDGEEHLIMREEDILGVIEG